MSIRSLMARVAKLQPAPEDPTKNMTDEEFDAALEAICVERAGDPDLSPEDRAAWWEMAAELRKPLAEREFPKLDRDSPFHKMTDAELWRIVTGDAR